MMTKSSYVSTPAADRLVRRLAQNVKTLRVEKGWTSAELAERAGLHWRLVQNIEQEKNSSSFVAVAMLAEALDVTINQLIYKPMVPVGKNKVVKLPNGVVK